MPIKWIREKLLEKQNTNYLHDFVNFFLVSLLISFFAELFFASVRDESIFGIIPGLELVDKILTQSPDYQSTIKVGDLPTFYGYTPGPPLGALIVFILRQIHYKKKSRGKRNEYPGSRILFLFLVFVPLLLLINFAFITYEGFVSYTLNFNAYASLIDPIMKFSYSFLSFFVYIAIFSAWLFDWFLFSKLWNG